MRRRILRCDRPLSWSRRLGMSFARWFQRRLRELQRCPMTARFPRRRSWSYRNSPESRRPRRGGGDRVEARMRVSALWWITAHNPMIRPRSCRTALAGAVSCVLNDAALGSEVDGQLRSLGRKLRSSWARAVAALLKWDPPLYRWK